MTSTTLTRRLRATLDRAGLTDVAVQTDPADPAYRVEPIEPASNPACPPRTVLVFGDWGPESAADLARQSIRSGIDVVAVRCDGSLALIGPYTGRGVIGCLACAERWRMAAATGPLPARVGMAGIVPAALAGTVAALVVAVLTGPRGTLITLDGHDATVDTHHVRPIGGCDVCTPPPDAPPDNAALPSTMDGLRVANPLATTERLLDELVDGRLGPVLRLERPDSGSAAITVAHLAIADSDGGHHASYGRAGTPAAADRIALFEAVERYCGIRPRGAPTIRRARWADLSDAVDPDTMARHDPALVGHPASRIRPYAAEVELDWVGGWSVSRQAPVLVPAQLAYWGGPNRHFYETSSGGAVGGSLAEAILHGLLEVAERDAILMAWYARTPLTRLEMSGGATTGLLADQLDALGFDVALLDASNDLGVPVVLALASHRDPGPGRPAALFAAAAHPFPDIAIRSTLTELATTASLARRAGLRVGHRIGAMMADPTEVRSMSDHSSLFHSPAVRDRYEFLLGSSAPPQPWPRIWPESGATDPDTQLASFVAGFAAAGLEVLAVDQTEPRLRDQLGLFCAKVIVPGTLPMTFGHVHHRTLGVPRLLRVPATLGRATTVPGYDDLTLTPHPFS